MRNIFYSIFSIALIYLVSACGRPSSTLQSPDSKNIAGLIESIVNNSQDNFDTHFIFVRHAEKQGGKDPALTKSGILRAQILGDILKPIKLNAIYSSDYKRTRETALKTSVLQSVETTIYNPRELEEFARRVKHKHIGENVLIVGHSNTTPNLINHLLQEQRLAQIPESQYNDIFIMSTNVDGEKQLKQLKYGSSENHKVPQE